MVRISRLPAPYPEQCIDVWPKGLQRKSMLNVSYSQQACIKICLQKTIQTRCKCQSAFLEQVEFNGTDFRICDTRKRSRLKIIHHLFSLKIFFKLIYDSYPKIREDVWRKSCSDRRISWRIANVHRDASELNSAIRVFETSNSN